MKLNVHLNFNGNAEEAFAFYKDVFRADNLFVMKWGQSPQPAPMPPGWENKVMHASLNMGKGILMGCDAPEASGKPMQGFQVSVESDDAAEVERVYNALKEEGSVQMPLEPTFWSPLFGMCTDKFGVAWMVGVLGESPA